MFNNAFKIYANIRKSRIANWNPYQIQEKTLLKLLAKNRATIFGKDHGFVQIRNIKDFQKQVPLRTYEDFWAEYYKEHFPFLSGISWFKEVPFFAVTSGTTTGRTKYIPITSAMLASNSKAGLDILAFHYSQKKNSKILNGKVFFLGGSTDLKEEAPGIFSGDLSGIAIKRQPKIFTKFSFPTPDLAFITNWEEKIQRMAQDSAHLDIRLLGGVPNWMLIFFEKMKHLMGSLENIKQIWPKFELLITGGVNFSPYQHLFKKFLGDEVAILDIYPASEGFIGIQEPGQDAFRLMLDYGIFYEFVPLGELNSKYPTRLTLPEVELDQNYALVMTTCAGLYAYILGDTVRFVSKDPYLIKITGRTSYFLSAFGEHLISEEVEKAIAYAAEKTSSSVIDFHVGPLFPDQVNLLGRHEYLVEFEQSPQDIKQFAENLDDFLCKINEDYEAHRKQDYGLAAPVVTILPKGSFKSWMESIGKLGGQHKVPRMDNSGEILNKIKKFLVI